MKNIDVIFNLTMILFIEIKSVTILEFLHGPVMF